MRFSTLSSALLLPLLTTARLTGFALPGVVAPGSTFDITLITEDYIQSVEDVAMAFGFAPAADAHNGSLGTTLLPEKSLGPDLSNSLTNFTHIVSIADDTPTGPIVVKGCVFSLYGVGYELTVTGFTADVTVGEGSGGLVGSTPIA